MLSMQDSEKISIELVLTDNVLSEGLNEELTVADVYTATLNSLRANKQLNIKTHAWTTILCDCLEQYGDNVSRAVTMASRIKLLTEQYDRREDFDTVILHLKEAVTELATEAALRNQTLPDALGGILRRRYAEFFSRLPGTNNFSGGDAVGLLIATALDGVGTGSPENDCVVDSSPA